MAQSITNACKPDFYSDDTIRSFQTLVSLALPLPPTNFGSMQIPGRYFNDFVYILM